MPRIENIADRIFMAAESGRSPGIGGFLGAALLVAILYWAQAVFIPVALSILLTFLLAPVVSRLQRWGINRALSVTFVVLLTVLLLGGTIWFGAMQIRNLADELPHYRANIRAKIGDLRELKKSTSLERFNEMVGEVRGELSSDGEKNPPTPPSAQRSAAGAAGQPFFWESWRQPIASAGLVLLLLTYMLAQREELRNRLIRLSGYGNLTITTHALEEMGERVSKYLLTQLAINSSFGMLVAVALALIDLPYAFLWGFLATLLIFIPVIGFWIAVALPTALSLAVFTSWGWPLFVVGLFLVLKTIINTILEPWLYGKSAGVLQVPLLILLAFWTWLWGPIGLILATPLTVSLLVFAKHVPQLEFLNLLMSDQPAMEAKISFYQRMLARDYDEVSAIWENFLRDQPSEKVYDALLLPALSYAKADRRRGRLSERQEQFIFSTAQALQEELMRTDLGHEAKPVPAQRIRIIGCPAEDDADERALFFLRDLLDPLRFDCQIVANAQLAAETIIRLGAGEPPMLVIAVLPPGGMARSRSLCKLLRGRFAQLKILVLCWQCAGDQAQIQQSFIAAGADWVSFNLLETRGQIGNIAGDAAVLTADAGSLGPEALGQRPNGHL
jgi:predicted PurR-regulated permease PerM